MKTGPATGSSAPHIHAVPATPLAREDGGIDVARVKAFRAAIANGTFRVDAGAIADKLLANAQAMLNHSMKVQ